MGEALWSRALQSIRDEILLWSKALAKKKGVRVSSRFLGRLENKSKTRQAMKYSINAIKKFKHDAHKRYYFMKKQASQLRESWLLDLAATQALHEGGN